MALLLAAPALDAALSSTALAASAFRSASSPLMPANVYPPGMPLGDHWASERLDGARGYWDGHQLLTRGGGRIVSRAWFTAGLLTVAMDGEL